MCGEIASMVLLAAIVGPPHAQCSGTKLINFILLQKIDVSGDDPKKVDGIFVTLNDVNLFTTGLFGCEASAEESFHTALVRRQMTVLGKDSMSTLLVLRTT